MNFQFLLENSPLLLFAIARIFALLFVSPLFSSNSIPALAKAALALILSVITLPHLVANGYSFPNSAGAFFLLLAGEVAIGLTMGLILQIYFSAFQVAGELFTTQIGFSASNVFDPMAEVELPIFGQFFNLIGTYLFLSVESFNKLFLHGLYYSFIKIRPENLFAADASAFLNKFFISGIGMMLAYAMQMAIPIVMILLVMSVTVGLLAKAAPQLNLLMLGFPLNITVGLALLFLVVPSMLNYFAKVLDKCWVFIEQWIMKTGGAI